MNDRNGLELLEEAVALVRRAPARAWTWYLAGAVPFFAALLVYVRAATGVLTVPDPSLPSILLALLFGWRQFTRSIFGRLLAAFVAGTEIPVPGSGWMQAFVRTWFAGLLRVALFPIPAPYLSTLFRNHQAYAWRSDASPFRLAAEMAGRGGNVLLSWLSLAAVSLAVWVNVVTGMLLGPMLYRIFTGEETILTRNSAALLNRTVLISSLILAWIICDVVLEAMYVLRRFYGESETSGADLKLAWTKTLALPVEQVKRYLAISAILLCLAPGLVAQPAQPRPATPPANLDAAITQVLAQPHYQWRQPEVLGATHEPTLIRWVRSVVNGFRKHVLQPIKRLWDRFWDWLLNRKPFSGGEPGNAPVAALRIASLLAILLLAGTLIALLLRTMTRKSASQNAPPPPVPVALDLEDPSIVATDLPEDQWLALAREFADKGDARMAIRAWFLATLAVLNRRQLVSVRRDKSNLDYRRELARRARGIAGLDGEFAAGVKGFEAAWYGLYPVGSDDVESFAAGFERMRGLCQ